LPNLKITNLLVQLIPKHIYPPQFNCLSWLPRTHLSRFLVNKTNRCTEIKLY